MSDGSRDDLPGNQQAIAEYLQELLNEVDDDSQDGESGDAPEAPGSGAAPARPAARRAEDRPAPPGTAVREPERGPQMPFPAPAPPEPEPQPEPEPEPEPEPQRDPEPATRPVREPEPTPGAPTPRSAPRGSAGQGGGAAAVPPDDDVPDWARPSFQALLFTVGNLRLAVPLIKLHSVVPAGSIEVEPLPSQPHWMDGLGFYRGVHVRVVNTAELVLPAERRPEPAALQPGKLLVVGDGTWALSCNDVEDVIKLQPGQVQWRSARGRRRWLSGTVREHLCALMDTDAFAELLEAEGGSMTPGGMVPGADSGQNE